MSDETPSFFSTERYGDPISREEAASRSAAERQAQINTMIVRYPVFKETVAALEGFHRPVAGGTHGTGRIVGLLGESRAGKTWAIKYYVESVGRIERADARLPKAVYVDAVQNMSSYDFAVALFKRFTLDASGRRNAHAVFDDVIEEIAFYGVELLVIDDAQFLLGSAFKKTVKDVFGFIVQLAERNVCNVVLAGMPEIRPAVERVEAAYNRGCFPTKYVKAYSWLVEEERRNFLKLLQLIDDRLPFREPSCIADFDIAAHLYRVSDGLIGRVMVYVQDAAVAAMNEGASRIERQHLQAAAAMRRAPNDPFIPFESRIDAEDPTGERRRRERSLVESDGPEDPDRGSPRPTLSKRKKRSPLG